MRSFKFPVILLIAVLCISACSAMTTKKTSAWMMSMYNSQYQEYLTWFEQDEQGEWKAREGVTEDQKETLRIKKRVLVELHPLLDAFAIYAETSKTPSGFDMEILEDRIIQLINHLMQLTMTEDFGND